MIVLKKITSGDSLAVDYAVFNLPSSAGKLRYDLSTRRIQEKSVPN